MKKPDIYISPVSKEPNEEGRVGLKYIVLKKVGSKHRSRDYRFQPKYKVSRGIIPLTRKSSFVFAEEEKLLAFMKGFSTIFLVSTEETEPEPGWYSEILEILIQDHTIVDLPGWFSDLEYEVEEGEWLYDGGAFRCDLDTALPSIYAR